MTSTLDTTFNEFKEWIMLLFAQTFSPNGSTFIHPYAYQKLGDKMFSEYAYNPEREQFLIQKTKWYIKICLDQSQSHNTSTNFLEKLTNKIAAYFSYYVMAKYPISENGKSKNKLRLRVQEELKKALFDDNAYIIYLKQKQVANRDFRAKTKFERKQVLHDQRRQDAKDAYRRSCQIKGMFFDAQSTPRKKH